MGEYRTTGWRSFFPTAFLLKTTLPALLLIGGGLAALGWAARPDRPGRPRARPWLYRAAPLGLFFLLYWAMAITMQLNIGHRHILPTYPIFYIFAGAAVLWVGGRMRRIAALALVALLAWHAIDSWLTRPFYLSYFQPLAGGVTRGFHYLVDSSYDWGQGLPDLGRWLAAKEHRGDQTPVFLTYFGADSPRARGLNVVRFADEAHDSGPRAFPANVQGGWFVISATHFRRVYLPVRLPWTGVHEGIYRAVRNRLMAAQSRSEPATANDRDQLLQDARDFEMLQFGRLDHYLENREPLEVIGGSLLVFKLTDAEVGFALNAPLAELDRRRAQPPAR